jgi:DNA-binding CsgD family transcriptional regulator
VIDLNACLLYENGVQDFPAAADLRPEIVEIILAPFHVGGRAVGTVWALCHDPSRRFEAEDMRLLKSIASFASLRIFTPPLVPPGSSVGANAARAALASLTSRQREILGRILRGQPNKNIAADLGISQRTAENHRAAIMLRMRVSSISALVQSALLGGEATALGETERSYVANHSTTPQPSRRRRFTG